MVTHETLCADAEGELRQLYSQPGLVWTSHSDSFLRDTGYLVPHRRSHQGHGPSHGEAAAVRAQVAQKWRERLSDEQVAEANEVLSAFANRGWVSPPATTSAVQPSR